MAISTFNSLHPLKPIVEGWLGKIDKAISFRTPWKDSADECDMFFAGSTGFLWDPKYKNKFWSVDDGAIKPKFQITLAKAFELVAIFGPALYWNSPVRTAYPKKSLEIPPEVVTAIGGQVQQPGMMGQMNLMGPTAQMDPMAMMAQGQASPMMQMVQGQQQNPMAMMGQMLYQQAMMQEQVEAPARALRAEMMGRYLNWTPDELRLDYHAELAITQALITGRGLLWTEAYRPPGSQQIMVGSFWQHVHNLLFDPDCKELHDAWWVALRCCEPVWQVERDRGLPPT